MAWTQPQLTNLRRVLAELYPREPDQRRIVDDAKLPRALIPFDPSAANSWSAILREANLRDLVDSVVELALADHPDHELLVRARESAPPAIIQGPELAWRGGTRTPRPILEKIIGTRSTLAPVSYLELGLLRARSVARIRCEDGSTGSGFLVPGNLLVTNHHVLADKAAATAAVAQFNYQRTARGTEGKVDERSLAPDAFFATSEREDWTAVAVVGDPAAIWGTLDLNPAILTKDALVNIIQHPGGADKQISIAPSVVVFVGDGVVQYLTDTLPGSSGAPVFDDRWNLVALHHSGGWLPEPGSDLNQVFLRNEGILIDVVIAGIASARSAKPPAG